MLSFKAELEIGDACTATFPVSEDINQVILYVIDSLFDFYKKDIFQFFYDEKMYKLLETRDFSNDKNEIKNLVYNKVNDLKKLRVFVNIVTHDDSTLTITVE